MYEAQTGLPHADNGIYILTIVRVKGETLEFRYRTIFVVALFLFFFNQFDNVQHELRRRLLLLIRNTQIPRKRKNIERKKKRKPADVYFNSNYVLYHFTCSIDEIVFFSQSFKERWGLSY